MLVALATQGVDQQSTVLVPQDHPTSEVYSIGTVTTARICSTIRLRFTRRHHQFRVRKDSRITVSFINGFMDKFQPTSVVNPNELLSAMRDSMQYGTSVVPRRTDVSVLSDACTDDEEAYLNSELP